MDSRRSGGSWLPLPWACCRDVRLRPATVTVAAGKGTGIVDGETPRLPRLTKDACAKPVKTLILPNEAGAQLAVQSGRADAFMTSHMAVSHIAKTAGGGSQFTAIEYSDEQDEHLISVGTRKSDRELADRIRASIEKLMDNGRYQEILDKYGVGGMALETTTINLKP